MKTNDSLVGGRLKDDPRVYRAYAAYLVRFVRAYRAEGVPVHALTIQNEPQNRNPDAYPGTDLPVRQAAKVIDELGPALRRAGLRTKILGYDHNWALHPNDEASTPPGEDPGREYPADLLASSAGRWLAGTAYHCYAGDQKRMTELHRQFPRKEIWFTECSGSHGPEDPPAKVFRDTLTWHARNITIGVPRNWASTVATWNLALRPDGGPHNGGCGTCTGVVGIAEDGTVTRNAEYYTLGHLSRFVRPGAHRVASSSYGSTGWNGLPMSVAFTNPDGSTVLVVHNEHDDPRTIGVAVGDRSFDYTLPGGALATFTWPAARHASGHDRLLDPWRTTVTASEGDASVAADDDGATAWRVAAQHAGQWVQVDLGSRRSVRDVVLDAGPGTYGWESPGTPSTEAPASYRLQVSADGRRWRDAGSGHGTGQLTTIRTPRWPVRHLRLTLTADAPQGWQVAEVRVHR
jgi:glucosylceramidase